uniref:site-specific DNA-methyltransferase (adenine-specific) n=1 Tax=Roseihalotalea indica TaxID=2867963 RepID=A0AA49GJU9_9BACT|nr:N-6 DNA methylase [Tunicatimonas sp. TK19036]
MASRELLLKSLQQPYDRLLFAKEVLSPVFGEGLNLYQQPIIADPEPNTTEKKVIAEVRIYAEITLEDTTEVSCYEIILQPHVRIDQNRVAIQHYIRKLLFSGQAALVNFVSSDHQKNDLWRLTLVAVDSEMTEEGIKEKATHSKRYTYLVEANRTNRTLAERLEKLAGGTTLNFDALVRAFSVETMSKDFFAEYKQHYQNFVCYLTGKRMVKVKGKWIEQKEKAASKFLKSVFNNNEKDARDFCKKLLGRIVFLYFIQKKRWLGASTTDYKDGVEDFIYQIFEETGGDKRFFPEGLTTLFFDVLNKFRSGDDYTTPGGRKVKMPYLNGGLFTRDRVDELLQEQGDIMTFPPELFSNRDQQDTPNERGFLDFLNAYNFTVYEDSPDDHTVAVDPEMLGHIFENLLEDNKDKGAFYTPNEIVSYMCQESLIEYLTTHLSKEYTLYKELDREQIQLFGNESRKGQLKLVQQLGGKALNRSDIEKIIVEKDVAKLTRSQLKRINELLDSVKICDPAIGSGAFPMGLLQEIFSTKEMIAYALDMDWNPALVKENIIQNSIYGVDIERGAVDIARLRFWLSLVVDIEKPKALPNLDYKIIVGDSLLSKFQDISGKFSNEVLEIDWKIERSQLSNMHVRNLKSALKAFNEKKALYFKSDKPSKRTLDEEIRQLKLRVLISQLKFDRERFINTTTEKGGFTPSAKERSFNLRRQQSIERYNILIGRLEELMDQPKCQFTYFNWGLDFAEVMNPIIAGNNLGFDIVLANPPYVSAMALKKILPSSEFQALKETYETAKGTVDLYIYFFEKGIKLLKENGQLAYISPNRYLSASYGTALRKYIYSNTTIKSIIDYSNVRVFKEASTYPILTFLEVAKNRKYNILIGKYSHQQSSLNYHYVSSEKLDMLDGYLWGYLLNDKIELTEKVINQSIKLGNACKINATSTASEAENYHSLINEKRGYKLVNTGTIDKYTTTWGREFLTDKGKKFLRPYLPKNSAIISENRKKLYSSEKIILAKIAIEAEAFLDDKGDYASINTNCLHSFQKGFHPKYVLAWINSKLYQFTFECFFEGLKMQGGYLLYSAPNLASTFIMKASDEDQLCISTLVDYITFSKFQVAQDVNEKLIPVYFEQIIDGIFYELYFQDLVKKFNREIRKNIGKLPVFTEEMSDLDKQQICQNTFSKLNDKDHPVRNNLFYLDSIPEIAIIEGKDANYKN